MKATTCLFLTLSVLVIFAAVTFSRVYTDDALTQRLYDSVILGDYEDAVTGAINFDTFNKSAVIEEAVKRLLDNKQRNTMEFAYCLWIGYGRQIVKEYFPIQFRLILNEVNVELINKRYNLAVKLGWATDGMNDRRAYGDGYDKSSDRVNWKLVPIWENNRLYFRIVNVKHNQNLKLEIEADDVGEHKAWGADAADTNRHFWFLQPAKVGNDMLFFIYNREYNQALKLGRAVDSDGDRVLWSHNGGVESQPEIFGWFIESYDTIKYLSIIKSVDVIKFVAYNLVSIEKVNVE